MSRPLLTLFLTAAAAFAASWWAGSFASSAFPRAGTTAAVDPTDFKAGLPGAEPPLPEYGLDRREAVLRRMENPGISDIRRMFETSGVDAENVARLADIWARQDPAGFWKWLNDGGRERLKGIDVTNKVFDAWFRLDPEAAIAAFRSVGQNFRFMAATGLMSSLLSDDEGLRRKLLPFLDELVTAGGNLPGQGPESAAIAVKLLKLPEGARRDMLLQATAKAWMDSDWKAASSWAAALPEPLRSKMLQAAVTVALYPNARTLYTGNDHEKPASYNDPACFEWARQWFSTEAPAALKQQLGQQFVETPARKDAGAALEWAQDNLGGRPLTKAIGKVLAQQAGMDPAAARAMVEGLPPGGVKQRAAFAMVTSPNPGSVNWLITQADKNSGTEWYGVASTWAFNDSDAFKKYLESADPATLPAEMSVGGLDNLIRKDAPGTLDWALRTQTPKVAGEALQIWSREDPPAAANWLKDHAADTAAWSGEHLGSVTSGYFKRSPSAAVDWANSLPEGVLRESTLASLRQNLTDSGVLKPEERSALQNRLGKP